MSTKELANQAATLAPSDASRAAGQLRGVLDGLPADESSYADKRLRHSLEMFLVGYRAGYGSR